MNAVIIAAVLVIALAWTIYCFWDEIKQFFVSGQRTNSTGPGSGPRSYRSDQDVIQLQQVASSTELAKAIECINDKILKQLIITKVAAGITFNQYEFFTNVLNANLEILNTQGKLSKAEKEKISKLQWISRGQV